MKKNIKRIADQILFLQLSLLEEENIKKQEEIKRKIEQISSGAFLLGMDAMIEIDNYIYPILKQRMEEKNK